MVWENLRNFTSRVNTYFGHEIDNILDIVIDILNQQDWQMNGAANHLEFQINTTQSGARIIDNLISHSAQWEQLTSQVGFIEYILAYHDRPFRRLSHHFFFVLFLF